MTMPHTDTGSLDSGRAWVFGDNIDTDVLAPGAYMKDAVEVLASHCLEAVDADFAPSVKPGDLVVGGANFGVGSSREQAAQALTILGVRAVIAKSFAGIFYRNAFNLGLLALVSADADKISAGDEIRIRPEAGRIENLTTGETFSCEPVPEHLMTMIRDGGLVPHLEKKLAAARQEGLKA